MDFNYMRRRSVFAPQTAPTYPPFDFNRAADAQNQNITDGSKLDAPRKPDEQSKFSSTYADLANEKGGPANQKYADFLNTNEPQRDDYKPTKMNRLSAILAGMSDGVIHGGGAGYKTAQGILDEPYNEALGQYDNQGKKLAISAGLEEKDMGRRVGILKDITAQERDAAKLAEEHEFHQGTLKNGADRNQRMGLHYADITDPTTGMRTSNVIGPNGPVGSFSLGKGGLSTTEAIDKAGKTAGAEASATEGSKKRVAAAGIAARGDVATKASDHKFQNIKDLLKWKNENLAAKYESKVDDTGQLIYFNKNDPNEEPIQTGFNTGKLSDTEKASLGLKNAKELKAAPSASTTKTTDVKRDKNGKVISSTTTTKSGAPKEEDLTKMPPPPGGKPGGKWSKLPSGKLVYTEPA